MAEPNRRNESEGPSPSDADSYEEEELEIEIEQMDRPLGSDRRGTTAEEQRRGASLEETSPDGQYGRREDRGMQLAEDDAPDDEPQLLGEVSDDDESPGSDVSPEERAMHEDPAGRGGVWREGDDYVDESES